LQTFEGRIGGIGETIVGEVVAGLGGNFLNKKEEEGKEEVAHKIGFEFVGKRTKKNWLVPVFSELVFFGEASRKWGKTLSATLKKFMYPCIKFGHICYLSDSLLSNN